MKYKDISDKEEKTPKIKFTHLYSMTSKDWMESTDEPDDYEEVVRIAEGIYAAYIFSELALPMIYKGYEVE
jgi:hypothetical protein